MKQQVYFTDLGVNQPYQKIWDLQESLLQEQLAIKMSERELVTADDQYLTTTVSETIGSTNKIQHSLSSLQHSPKHYLLFVEHNPVYTLGKSGNIKHVLINEERRKEQGIEFFSINRGGDITFHGPGQLVGYPIFDLEKFRTDVGWYLRSLEEVIILTLAEYGLKGDRSKGETGVWLDPDIRGKERKICAMGIRCSRWITMHGFAFNINTDLSYFNFIIPCGIQNKQVTSLQKELGRDLPMEKVKEKVKQNFERVFDVEIVSSE